MRGIANTETTSLVDKGDFILFLGVPVICFGLKNATQLNGKIGYIRAFDEGICCYKVSFIEEFYVSPKE